MRKQNEKKINFLQTFIELTIIMSHINELFESSSEVFPTWKLIYEELNMSTIDDFMIMMIFRVKINEIRDTR